MNRKFLMAGISALALTAAGSAMADNENDVFIDQSASNSQIDTDQEGNRNTIGLDGSPVLQSGVNQDIWIDQDGNDNVVGARQKVTGGLASDPVEQSNANNDLTIDQEGNRNVVRDLSQSGTNGDITLTQDGNDNEIGNGGVDQRDNNNSMTVTQEGNENGDGRSRLRQAGGNNNDMDVLLDGNNNNFALTQFGDANDLDIDIDPGNGNSIRTIQGSWFGTTGPADPSAQIVTPLENDLAASWSGNASTDSWIDVDMFNGNNNTLALFQEDGPNGYAGARNNIMDIDINNSSFNEVAALQSGSDNTLGLLVRQGSDNNEFTLMSVGDRNAMDIELYNGSDNNEMFASQTNNDNFFKATLNNADNGMINVVQSGSNSDVVVCQGSGCTN